MNNNDWNKVFPEVPQNFHEAVQRTLDTQIINKVGRRKGMKKKFVIVLAAAIAALSVTTAAAYVFHWNEKLVDRFKVNEDQQNRLANDGAVADVNQTVTKNGVTISAIQTLGDKNGIYILFNIKAPEGITLTKDGSGIGMNVNIEGVPNVSYSSQWVLDSEKVGSSSKGRGECYYELWLNNNAGGNWNGKDITVEFANLRDLNKGPDNNVTVPGKWELSWKLSYADQMKSVDINKAYTVNGKEIVVKSVEFSPLSMTFNLGGNGLGQLVANSDLNEAGGLCSVSLMKRDGSTIDEGARGESYSGNTYTQDIRFGRVHDLDQITGFVLTFYHEAKDNSLTIPLS